MVAGNNDVSSTGISKVN